MTDPRPARVPGPRSLRALAEGCDAHARPTAPDPYGPRDAYGLFGPHTTRPRPEPSPLPPGRPAPAQLPVGAVVFGLALQSLRRGSASGANPVRGRADAARSIGAAPGRSPAWKARSAATASARTPATPCSRATA